MKGWPSYIVTMIRTLFIAAMLWPSQALAMNWEGHDDWMLDFGPAAAFLEAVPKARPLPSRDCPVTEKMAAENPYEQIPLPRHNCPSASAEEASPQN